MKRLWLNLLIISSIISLIVSCAREPEQQFVQIDERIPDEQADSIHVFATNADHIEYEMTATHMDKFYDTQETLADTVFVTFYNKDGTIKSTLAADKAVLKDAENLLEGSGNVVIESENGIMKAPRVIWNRNTNIVFARDGVTLIRNDNVLKGREMKTDLYLDKVQIIDVSAEGELKDEDLDW